MHSFVGQAEAAGEIVGSIGLGTPAAAAGVLAALVVSTVIFGAAAVLASRAHRSWVDAERPAQRASAPALDVPPMPPQRTRRWLDVAEPRR